MDNPRHPRNNEERAMRLHGATEDFQKRVDAEFALVFACTPTTTESMVSGGNAQLYMTRVLRSMNQALAKLSDGSLSIAVIDNDTGSITPVPNEEPEYSESHTSKTPRN